MAGKLPQSNARHAEGVEASQHFAIDRPKAWLLLATHCLLPAFIVWRVLQGGGALREDLVALVVVLGVFGFAAWSVVRELRAPGPAVVLEPEGFRDYRRGPELVPWSKVAEAGLKRGILSRGVKIVLEDGTRVDIDTSLLKVRPRQLTGLVVEALRRRQEHERQP